MTSDDVYDEHVARLAERTSNATEVYEALAVEDVRKACDRLRRVHEASGGDDGFVSLEVSPHLAHDDEATIAEAHRLWREVDRPNAFIKIPATTEGLTAIGRCLEDGINVNVTLLFSVKRYREVLETWFAAMESRRRRGDPATVRSVASFFLSRIDARIDPQLDEIAMRDPALADQARAVRGRAAVASAKLAYSHWSDRFARDDADWARLRDAGFWPQRLLWASTSTKDPTFDDTKYVRDLIGPRTISTMPRATLEAFRDHGVVEPTLTRGLEDAREVTRVLASLGIDLEAVASDLVEEGVEKFAAPFDELIAALKEKSPELSRERSTT